MLTGYNTDIRRGDTVVHVQTEDKGKENPCFESLIYVGGRVVASKRSSYAERLENGDDEATLSRLMDHQHRTIVAAIERGRFDEELRAGGVKSGDAGGGFEDETPSGVHAVVSEDDLGAAEAPPSPTYMAPTAEVTRTSPVAQEPPESATPPESEAPPSAEVAPEAEAPPPPARQAVGMTPTPGLALDLSTATSLVLGDTVVVWVRASQNGEPKEGVEIRIEMISTVQAPVLLVEGKSDPEGLFKADVDIPDLESGSAAIIVSGAGGGGFAEVKELI